MMNGCHKYIKYVFLANAAITTLFLNMVAPANDTKRVTAIKITIGDTLL